MAITRAIIPVGGLGTRFLPATKNVPKELFPVLNKPVIQLLVEELATSGIEDIIFVVSPDKGVIRDYFSPHSGLEGILESRGKHDLAADLQRISSLARFHFVEQTEPLGDGHALLCARDLVKDEPCVVIFGDTLVDHSPSMTSQLLDAHEKRGGCVVGVMPVPMEESASYGIVDPQEEGGVFEIGSFVEKPAPDKAPSNLAVIGSYVITPSVFEELSKKPSSVGGEIRLIDGFSLLREKEAISGCKLSGTWLDTGSVFGLLKANIHFAMKDEELRAPLGEYLESLS